MAKQKRPKLKLADLVQKGPSYRQLLADLEPKPKGRGGRPLRPGKADPHLWGAIHAIMWKKKCSHRAACHILAKRFAAARAHHAREMLKPGEQWREHTYLLKHKKRSESTVERYGRMTEKQYRADPQFKAEADDWHSIFKKVEDGAELFDAYLEFHSQPRPQEVAYEKRLKKILKQVAKATQRKKS